MKKFDVTIQEHVSYITLYGPDNEELTIYFEDNDYIYIDYLAPGAKDVQHLTVDKNKYLSDIFSVLELFKKLKETKSKNIPITNELAGDIAPFGPVWPKSTWPLFIK